jgi:type IV pilus assembly protein PilC
MVSSINSKITTSDMMWSWSKFSASFSVPSLAVKTNFFRLLSVGQRVWLWLRESLVSLSKSEHNTVMKNIVDDMIAQINQWINLADAMKKHNYLFLSTEIELVRAAQGMGNIPEVLEEISNELENYNKIQWKIKGALMYPATLLVFSAIATAILLVKVIPTIVELFPDKDKLPEITKMTLMFSDFMINWWYVIALLVWWSIVTFQVLYKYFLPCKIFVDGWLLKIPVLWDAIKTFYMYRFSKLLWDFLHAGVNQIDAMTQIANIFDNFFYKKKAEDIKSDLGAWFTFVDTIEWSDLFDPILIQIIVVGEQTGNLSSILKNMATFYKEQLMQKISIVMSFIEPILMVFVAVIIWSIVSSIFLPLADLVNVIGG